MNFQDTFSRFYTIPECHGQTDGQTEWFYASTALRVVSRAIRSELETSHIVQTEVVMITFYCFAVGFGT